MRRLVTILGGLAVLAVLLAPATGQAEAWRAPAARAAQAAQEQELTDVEQVGRQLYLNQCASCHGVDLKGTPSGNGPSLFDVGGADAVDYVLRTGRMPLAAPNARPHRGPPRFSEEEIRALVAYTAKVLNDDEIATAQVSNDPEVIRHGRELFQENCAACHGTNGAGAAIGGGFDAPSLWQVDAKTVAEAMRIGPNKMPVFAGEQYPQEDVDAIASYVLTLGEGEDYNHGGVPIGGRGPVAEGFVAWIIGLGSMILAARLLGTRTPKEATGE